MCSVITFKNSQEGSNAICSFTRLRTADEVIHGQSKHAKENHTLLHSTYDIIGQELLVKLVCVCRKLFYTGIQFTVCVKTTVSVHLLAYPSYPIVLMGLLRTLRYDIHIPGKKTSKEWNAKLRRSSAPHMATKSTSLLNNTAIQRV